MTGKDEADFYAELGLDDAFAVCAVGDVLEERPGFTGRNGWGFSVADMVRLGLANTVYLGSGRYEQDSAGFLRYLARISAEDCRQLLPPSTPSPGQGTHHDDTLTPARQQPPANGSPGGKTRGGISRFTTAYRPRSRRQWLFVLAMVVVGFLLLASPIDWPDGTLGSSFRRS